MYMNSTALFRLNRIFAPEQHVLTHKQPETQGCVLSTIATDALVLKHQGISIQSAD